MMSNNGYDVKKPAAAIALVLLMIVVVYDSSFHWDGDLAALKRKHDSAQRHWTTYYDQSYVYKHSSMRYHNDLAEIDSLVEQGSMLISDLTTSYYAAAYTGAYIANVHRHHGRWQLREWNAFLNKRVLCYMEFEENLDKVSRFFKTQAQVNYIIVNKDTQNANRSRDCLAFRSHTLLDKVPVLGRLLFEGEYLNLYKLDFRKGNPSSVSE